MNNLIIKITVFLKTYKWLLLLAVPVLLFIGFIVYLFSTPPSTQIPTPSLPTTPSPTQNFISEEDENLRGVLENELDEDIELRPDFQKKEIRSDGNIVYTFSSENPSRPELLIINSNKELIFSREVNSTNSPMTSISVLNEELGQPERIINGSKFYGKQVNVYIYASLGLAIIADPQTNEAFEGHHFPSMSVEAYLQRYGDQN